MAAGQRPGPNESTLPRAWNETNLPLARNFSAGGINMDTYFLHITQGVRQTRLEDNDYWTVYVAGVYEIFPQAGDPMSSTDNDPNTEYATLGWTIFDEPEYSMIPMEVIRDVAAQHGWTPQEIAAFQRIVALHEIGHQFELSDVPGDFTHVMGIHRSDTEEPMVLQLPTTFREPDVVTIRRHGSGSRPFLTP